MNSWMKFSGAVTIGLALTLGTAARAQPTDGPPPPQPDQRDGQGDDRRGSADKKDRQDRREGRRGGLVRQIGQIARELNLDESQRRAIRDIFEQSREDAQRIHEEIQDAGARQAELQKLAEKVRTDVEKELTDEQLTTFRQKMDELKKQNPERENGSRFPMIDRLDDSLKSLNLTEEQRPQIDQLLTDLRKRAEEIRADALDKDPEVSRDKVRELMRETHRDLQEILTPEQADELRERLRPANEQGNNRRDDKREKRDRSDEPRDGPKEGPNDGPNDGPPPQGMNDSQPENEAGESGLASSMDEEKSEIIAPKPGDAAPSFELASIDNKSIKSTDLYNKPTVLIFGSYTIPAFREKLGAFNELAKANARRANFVIVYTAEAHPAGENEIRRNIEEKISIPAHKTLADRIAHAKKLKEDFKLDMPVACENLDGELSKSLASFPNGVVIIDDGKIHNHNRWADPHAIEVQLQALFDR